MHREPSGFLIINGVKMPCPAPGFTIVRSQAVDAGRNTYGVVVGQKIGRKLWKIENLQWNGLDADQWKMIQDALAPFYVYVTFTGDDNIRHTVKMYPSDTKGEPLFLNGVAYKNYRTCSFNLIDCGE